MCERPWLAAGDWQARSPNPGDLPHEKKKFKSVARFITGAKPLHRGHDYTHKNALDEVDGVLVQPLVKMAKREYLRQEYRMLAYHSVLETYYPTARTIMSPLPA